MPPVAAAECQHAEQQADSAHDAPPPADDDEDHAKRGADDGTSQQERDARRVVVVEVSLDGGAPTDPLQPHAPPAERVRRNPVSRLVDNERDDNGDEDNREHDP